MTTERPLRILHVLRAPVGGLFRHVVDLAREQAARGHAVGLFCDASTGGERAERTLAELGPCLSLGVTRIAMRRNPHPSDLAALLALHGVVRRLTPDVLHGHGSKGGAYARLVRPVHRAGRAIRAYTPHGGSFNYRPGTALHRLYMLAEAILARRTEAFLFESEFIAGRFHAHVGATDRLERIVLNGIAEAEFEPIKACPNQGDLVYVGEMRAAKGVDTLIQALGLLHRRGRPATLLAVGSGPDEAQLRAQAESAGVAHAIAFEGAQPIRRALGRGRVMVVPSRAESLPYVVLEAAAAHQPWSRPGSAACRRSSAPMRASSSFPTIPRSLPPRSRPSSRSRPRRGPPRPRRSAPSSTGASPCPRWWRAASRATAPRSSGAIRVQYTAISMIPLRLP